MCRLLNYDVFLFMFFFLDYLFIGESGILKSSTVTVFKLIYDLFYGFMRLGTPELCMEL